MQVLDAPVPRVMDVFRVMNQSSRSSQCPRSLLHKVLPGWFFVSANVVVLLVEVHKKTGQSSSSSSSVGADRSHSSWSWRIWRSSGSLPRHGTLKRTVEQIADIHGEPNQGFFLSHFSRFFEVRQVLLPRGRNWPRTRTHPRGVLVACPWRSRRTCWSHPCLMTRTSTLMTSRCG